MNLTSQQKNSICSKYGMVLISLLFILISSCNSLNSKKSVVLIKAIPNNVSFIIQINNLAQLDSTIQTLPYKDEFMAYSWMNSLQHNHKALSNLLQNVIDIDSSANIPMVASLHLANAEELNAIHYYPLSLSKKSFNKILEAKFPGASKHSWQYQNTTITEVLIPAINQKIAVAYVDHILIASPISFFVEDAVKQLNNSSNLLDDDSFKKVYNKQSSLADLNVWFKQKNLKKWMTTFSASNANKQIEEAANFADWMLFDIYLNENDISLSGITATNKRNKLHQFSNRTACTNKVIPLPSNTAIVLQYDQLPDTLLTPIKTAGIKDCWTKVLTEPNNQLAINNYVLLFERDAQEKLSEENLLAIDGIGQQLLARKEVFGKDFNNFYIVASDKTTLKNYYNSISKEQILGNDAAYSELQEAFTSDFNLKCYTRTAYTKELLQSIYRNDATLQQTFEQLSNFNQAAFQFTQAGDIYKTNGVITYAQNDISKHSNLVWKKNLEADIIAGPQIIDYGTSKSRHVLVQDENFKIYLVDSKGNFVWTKQLNSRWLGDASVANLYNDNSRQLTFNTQLNWYLIDQSGNDLAGFPLKFKDDASGGLTLAKVNKKYSVFIPFSNQKLYGYEISGKPLLGWNPQDKVGNITKPIQALTNGNKTYISVLNENGTIQIWDINGKKIKSAAFNNKFPSNNFVDRKANPTKLKNVKSNGELVSVNTSGSVGKFKLPVRSVNQFFMANIKGNSDPEIIVRDDKTITVFSYTGERQWAKNIEGTIEIIKSAKGRSNIAVLNSKQHNVIVLDASGKIISKPDFYIGDQYCIGNLLGDDQIAIVSGGKTNELFCYRLSVE